MSKYLKKEIEERKSSLINKLNQKECYGMDFCMDHDFEYKRMIEENDKLKVHIKINTGMNRLGTDNKEDFKNNKYYRRKVRKSGI